MKGVLDRPALITSQANAERDIAMWLRDEDNKWRELMPNYILLASDRKDTSAIMNLAINQTRAATATINRTSDLLIKAYPEQAASLESVKRIYTAGTDSLTKAVNS